MKVVLFSKLNADGISCYGNRIMGKEDTELYKCERVVGAYFNGADESFKYA